MIAETSDDTALRDTERFSTETVVLLPLVRPFLSSPSLSLPRLFLQRLSSQALVMHGVWVVKLWQTSNEVHIAKW